NSKVAFVIRGGACYGARARRAKRSGRSSAKAPGSSYPGHRQKPSSWMPCVKPRPRTWSKKDSVLLRIANGSACRAAPSDRPKRNSINCVRGGRHYSIQAQGDFRGTATPRFFIRSHLWLIHPNASVLTKKVSNRKPFDLAHDSNHSFVVA